MKLKSGIYNRIQAKVATSVTSLQKSAQKITETVKKNAKVILATSMIAGGAQALEHNSNTQQVNQASSGWSLTDAKGESIDNIRELISSKINYHTEVIESKIASSEKDFIKMPVPQQGYSYKNAQEISSKITPQIQDFEKRVDRKRDEAIKSGSYKPSWTESILNMKVVSEDKKISYVLHGSSSSEGSPSGNLKLSNERARIVQKAIEQEGAVYASVDTLSDENGVKLDNYANKLRMKKLDLIRQYNKGVHFGSEVDEFLEENFAKKRGVSIEKTTQINQAWQGEVSVPVLPFGIFALGAGLIGFKRKIASLGRSVKKGLSRAWNGIGKLFAGKPAVQGSGSDAAERLRENIAEVHEEREKVAKSKPLVVAKPEIKYRGFGKRYAAPQGNSAAEALERLKKGEGSIGLSPDVSSQEINEDREGVGEGKNKKETLSIPSQATNIISIATTKTHGNQGEDQREYEKLREAITRFDQIVKNVGVEFEEDCQLVRSKLIRTYHDTGKIKESWGEVRHALVVLIYKMNSAFHKNTLSPQQAHILNEIDGFSQKCFAPSHASKDSPGEYAYRDDRLGDEQALGEIKKMDEKYYPTGTKFFVKTENYTGWAKVISSSRLSVFMQIGKTNVSVSPKDLEKYILEGEFAQEESSATVNAMLQKDWLTPKEKHIINGTTYYITRQVYTESVDLREEKKNIVGESLSDRLKRITIRQEYIGVYVKNGGIMEGWIFCKQKNGDWNAFASNKENYDWSIFGEVRPGFIKLHESLTKIIEEQSSHIDSVAKDRTKDILTPLYSIKPEGKENQQENKRQKIAV